MSLCYRAKKGQEPYLTYKPSWGAGVKDGQPAVPWHTGPRRVAALPPTHSGDRSASRALTCLMCRDVTSEQMRRGRQLINDFILEERFEQDGFPLAFS